MSAGGGIIKIHYYLLALIFAFQSFAYADSKECGFDISNSEFAALYQGANYNREIDAKVFVLQDIDVKDAPTSTGKAIANLKRGNNKTTASFIKHYDDTDFKSRSDVWYKVNLSSKDFGWINSEDILVLYDPKHITDTCIKNTRVFLNHKVLKEGGAADAYLIFNNSQKVVLLSKNISFPEIYCANDILYLRYLENIAPGFPTPVTGKTFTVKATRQPQGNIKVESCLEVKNPIVLQEEEY